jgi:hypothetical protein
VQIRCGAAAVIGEALEPKWTTAAGASRPKAGRSFEAVTSRKPEDLPVE